MILLSTVEDDERDIERRSSPYMSRREFKIIIFIFLLLMIPSYFLYGGCKRERDYVVSKENLHAMFGALSLYAQDNNEGFPTVFQLSPDGQVLIDGYGRPVVWANLALSYVEARKLNNPSSKSDWDFVVTKPGAGGEGTTVSYGMLSSLSTARYYDVNNPSECILLAETISSGLENSLNPLPIGVEKDGFAIGYDDSNGGITSSSKYATRLAFTSEEKHANLSKMNALHAEKGTLGISVSGSLRIIRASDLTIPRNGKLAAGPWAPFR